MYGSNLDLRGTAPGIRTTASAICITQSIHSSPEQETKLRQRRFRSNRSKRQRSVIIRIPQLRIPRTLALPITPFLPINHQREIPLVNAAAPGTQLAPNLLRRFHIPYMAHLPLPVLAHPGYVPRRARRIRRRGERDVPEQDGGGGWEMESGA
jgi:hypothetical protein